MRVRRGGVESGPGRVLAQAVFSCLVVAGCAADPSPALLSLVDPARMTLVDSELLDDSVKAAIRSYLGRRADSAWDDVTDPALERLVGECRVHTAVLDRTVLPLPGRTTSVLVEIPDTGFAEFRLTRMRGQAHERPTYTGQTRNGTMSILMIGDSLVAGRITSRRGDFEFESGPFGLVTMSRADTVLSRRALHLMSAGFAAPASRAATATAPVAAPTSC